MTNKPLSPRLAGIVDALPLQPGMRVLEIGCGPGGAARAVAARLGHGRIVAIDRSAKAIDQARSAPGNPPASRLEFVQAAIEDFELRDGEPRFDLAFAVRVGALDGRHPKAGEAALRQLRRCLAPNGRLFIDGGSPLREIDLRSD